MNRKHKHKQNKQTNQVTPQKTQDKEEKESEVKIEERVPEIVSSVLPESSIEIKNDFEVETPNKPKRNRRKKKNDETSLEEKSNEEVVQNVIEEEQVKPNTEANTNVKVTEIKSEDHEHVIPSSRKNKNKNKNADKTVPKLPEVEAKKVKDTEISVTVKESQSMKPEVMDIVKESQGMKTEHIKEEISNDKLETDNIQLKKKNKSKKNKKSKPILEQECEIIDKIDKTQHYSHLEESEKLMKKEFNKLPIELQEQNTSNETKLKEEFTKNNNEKDKDCIPQLLKDEIKEDSSKLKKKNKKKLIDSERSDTSTAITTNETNVIKDTKKEIEIPIVKSEDISKYNQTDDTILDILSKEIPSDSQNIIKAEKNDTMEKEIKIETNEVPIKCETKETLQKSKRKNKKKQIEKMETDNTKKKEEPIMTISAVLEPTINIGLDTQTEDKCKVESDQNMSITLKLEEKDENSDNLKSIKFKPILQLYSEETKTEIKCEDTSKNNSPIKTEPRIIDYIKDQEKPYSEQSLEKDRAETKGKQKSKKLQSDQIKEQKLDEVESLLNPQSEQTSQLYLEKESTETKDRQETNKNIAMAPKKDTVAQQKVDKINVSSSVIQFKPCIQLPIENEAFGIKDNNKTEETLPLQQNSEKSKEQVKFSEKHEQSTAEVKKNKKPLLSIELKSAKVEHTELNKPEDIKCEEIIEPKIMKDPADDNKEVRKDGASKSKNKKEKHPVVIKDHSNNFKTPTSSQQQMLTSDNTVKLEHDKQADELLTTNIQQSITLEEYKTQDSGSSDITPDSIEFQKSVSECNMSMDPNNKSMFVKEITTPDIPVHTLNIPVLIPDTPFIKEIENLPSPIKITSRDIPLPTIRKSEPIDTTEKTDLKSKVLEVNQDMEELRLSIEKSLAELTCMETSEEIPELIYLQSSIDQNMATTTLMDDEIKIKSGPLQQQIETNIITKPISSNIDMFPKFKNVEEPKKDEQPTIMPSVAENESVDSVTLASILESPPINQMMMQTQLPTSASDLPSCPARKDKGKGKSKKYSKDAQSCLVAKCSTSVQSSTTNQQKADAQTSEQNKSESQQQQKKEQSGSDNKQKDEDAFSGNKQKDLDDIQESSQNFEPIENFEDAMTSSSDDVNKSFEIIAEESTTFDTSKYTKSSSEAAEYSKDEEKKLDEKLQNVNPLVSNPKNLLGHPDIPVRSNKIDYKKEKSKPPNTRQARVRIKDAISPEKTNKQSKESQTENQPKLVNTKPLKYYDPYLNEDYVYKYSFRNVFLPHVCHVCKKKLGDVRVTCDLCNLFFYCSSNHKDDDWSRHQSLCIAVSTIVHLKGQKYVYQDSKEVTGMNYRLLRMQMIVSCEKILKRRLVPWEQEAFLYPRMCAEPSCREWRHNYLKDCESCGQISYCKSVSEHFPKNHLRWCKSYSLYQKLVIHQQTRGRLEPRLPTKVITAANFEVPDKINELLATMYEEKIDMDDLQYAALTQLATAPLTAAYSHQVYSNVINTKYANGVHKKSSFTLHVVGAELQFEADALNKWEIFFLHLRPDVKELNIVLIGPDLNPSNLPLELLAKIKLCENCRQNNRKIIFNFYDKKLYNEFANSEDFTFPDIVCAFNPSLNRSLGINGKDSWSATVNSILKLRTPFCITSYTPEELPKDLARIKQYAAMNYKTITEPSHNPYASIRPDRNFISDDEMPLLFKNYSYAIICGQY